VLEYGEIFFQSTLGQLKQSGTITSTRIIGRVFIVRSPAIHPGDVRVLTAVDRPGMMESELQYGGVWCTYFFLFLFFFSFLSFFFFFLCDRFSISVLF
jgi:hypothetical protein